MSDIHVEVAELEAAYALARLDSDYKYKQTQLDQWYEYHYQRIEARLNELLYQMGVISLEDALPSYAGIIFDKRFPIRVKTLAREGETG